MKGPGFKAAETGKHVSSERVGKETAGKVLREVRRSEGKRKENLKKNLQKQSTLFYKKGNKAAGRTNREPSRVAKHNFF